jgi:hypothetical protein
MSLVAAMAGTIETPKKRGKVPKTCYDVPVLIFIGLFSRKKNIFELLQGGRDI